MDQRTRHPSASAAPWRALIALLGLGWALLLAGCATTDPYRQAPIAAHLERTDQLGECARGFREHDRAIAAAGVRDAGATRIAGFPYLRTNRFLAGLGADATDAAQGQAWLGWLARLDAQSRRAESANAAIPPAALAALDRCRALLARADEGELAALRGAARVPDDYSSAARAAGLYPLTRLPFAVGVRGWQSATRTAFATPLATGRAEFAPAGPETPATLGKLARDRLDVPVPSPEQLAVLLARHAPVFSVELRSDADRIGRVEWNAHGKPRVDPAQPTVYTRIDYTRVAGRPALQLVYTAWFDERPAAGWWDPLAGRLDGLIWRVTLDEAGTPLVYDSIHPCGCYLLFVPTPRVRPRPASGSLDEGLFAPQTIAAPRADQQIVLAIESGTHYLQRVALRPRAPAAPGYALLDESALQNLAVAGGATRSLFDEAGLVPGTERGERWWFWPMGVASAGQMRQAGRHATAFVGRRHFDDPQLFDLYFERLDQGAP